MSAPILAEGAPTFEDRAGGAYVVVTFPNGASLVLSRGDLYSAGRHMVGHAVLAFEQQKADILQLRERVA